MILRCRVFRKGKSVTLPGRKLKQFLVSDPRPRNGVIKFVSPLTKSGTRQLLDRRKCNFRNEPAKSHQSYAHCGFRSVLFYGRVFCLFSWIIRVFFHIVRVFFEIKFEWIQDDFRRWNKMKKMSINIFYND